MKKIVKMMILIIGISRISTVEAMSLVSFGDYDFSQLSYDNRIMISADITDADFESAMSLDSNGDGEIDALEQNTFVVSGDSASLYLGNAHNSYDIARALLFVGSDGEWTSFSANGIAVNVGGVAEAGHPDVFFVDGDVAALLDHVALFEIEHKLEDREPNDSPIGQNGPYEVILSDVVSNDPTLRLYCGAYGFIGSGTMNSYTPLCSAVLFLPSIEMPEGKDSGSNSMPVPEPTMLLLFGTSGMYLLKMKERRQS